MEWPGEADRAENFIGCGWGEAGFPTELLCQTKPNRIRDRTLLCVDGAIRPSPDVLRVRTVNSFTSFQGIDN